jgi:outer membrane protein assembly factor BamB
LWKATTGNGIASSPAVAGGVVYVASFDDNVYAFPATASCSTPCSSLWTATTGIPVSSSPTVADGSVFLAAADGFLHVYDLPSAGTTRAHRRPHPRSLHRNRHLRLRHRTRGRAHQVRRAAPVPGGA